MTTFLQKFIEVVRQLLTGVIIIAIGSFLLLPLLSLIVHTWERILTH